MLLVFAVLRDIQFKQPDSAHNPYAGWSTALLLASLGLWLAGLFWGLKCMFSRRRLPLLFILWLVAASAFGLLFFYGMSGFLFGWP